MAKSACQFITIVHSALIGFCNYIVPDSTRQPVGNTVLVPTPHRQMWLASLLFLVFTDVWLFGMVLAYYLSLSDTYLLPSDTSLLPSNTCALLGDTYLLLSDTYLSLGDNTYYPVILAYYQVTLNYCWVILTYHWVVLKF